MRKILIVGILAFAMIASVGLVNASTTFHAEWNGGSHYYNFQSDDDAQSQFWTGGSHGTYDAKDYDDNPYGYNVDTTDVKIDAHVTSNGYIEHLYNRTDSCSSYGVADEQSYTLITTDDTADFKWSTWSNYASLKCCNYKYQSNDQIKATGNHQIHHWITDSGGSEGAGIDISANGNTELTIMGESAGGKTGSFQFGHACGCYSNGNVDITGTGTFDLYANADNEITTEFGVATDGYLHVGAIFSNGFNFANFALAGN